MATHKDVEFKTLDDIILRGSLYPASRRGPAIILTPGVSQFTRPVSVNAHTVWSINLSS
jgi:hypothetical protein